MDAATLACAPSGATWHGINWADIHRQVRRLQARIVKAIQEGRHNKVKALQWLLTHSFSGKALAVKRVTDKSRQEHPRCGQRSMENTGGKDQRDSVDEAAGLFATSTSGGFLFRRRTARKPGRSASPR